MQPNSNYGTERAHEELDPRFNQVLSPKVIKPPLVPPEYSDAPVPAKVIPDPRRLANQQPVR